MEVEEFNRDEDAPFSFAAAWPSIAVVGGIFSVISFVISLFFGYQQINAEPSGSFFSPMILSSAVICLVTMFAGLLAVWHYTKEVSPKMKLGQGALVGFLTGAFLLIVSTVLNELWHLIDPEYTEKMMEAFIANVEMMDLPSDVKEDMIDSTAQTMTDRSFLRDIFIGIPVPGLLNMATAMIGVKVFAKKEEESF